MQSSVTTPTPLTARRSPRSGPGRITAGYLVVVVSIALSSVVFLAGWIAAIQCEGDGFTCLGWMVGGMIGAAFVAAVLTVIFSLWQRMGIIFPLLTIALVALAAAVPGIDPIRVLIGVAAPGIASWITMPREVDSSAGSKPRRLGIKILILVLILLLAPVAVLGQELKRVNYRESLYVKEGATPLGLPDDAGWSYELVRESVVDRGFAYTMINKSGVELDVAITHAEDSDLRPPANCSIDPGKTAPCETRSEGVYLIAGDNRLARIVVRGDSIAVVRILGGAIDDAEFDAQVAAFQPQSARWLATRECGVCRLLG